MKKLIISSLMASLSLSSLSFAHYEELKFPSLDIYKVHSLEVEGEVKGRAPHFAVPREVSLNALTSQAWEKSGSNYIWTARIRATNAVSLNLAFEEFKLSKNSKLFISSFDRSLSIRPFTAKDNNAQNELWTPVIMSEDILVELVVPEDEMNDTKLALTKVNQGFRTFAQKTDKAGSCNVDVACREGNGWRDEINSVAVISSGGSAFCTGFMVNNAKYDKTPYFMTAYHCGIRSHNSASLVTYWNYQASTCGGHDEAKTEFQTGSTFISESRKSDFTLVRLNSNPNDAWNVRFAGWDNSGANATTAVAIHHPNVDKKSISFDYDGTSLTDYLGKVEVKNGTHVRVENWDVGTTEPGSSGSPLFNQDHRVIGQLHGGYASCSNRSADYYGSFQTSWEGDGTSSSRLKDWLDPENTGISFVDTI